MENHPIPQDVTGFKFKLIGSVTLKQFLYILGGGILAAICFILPISGLIKLPFAFLFGGLGVAVAFIPIEGRPMDVMLKNFLKALPSENRYIFKKRGAEALIFDFFTIHPTQVETPQQIHQEDTSLNSRRALLYKTLKKSYRPDQNEEKMLTNINAYLHESSNPTTSSVQNLDSAPQTIPSPLQIVAPPASPVQTTTAPIAPPIIRAAQPDPQVITRVSQKIQNFDTQKPMPVVSSISTTVVPSPSPVSQAATSPITTQQASQQQGAPTNPTLQTAPIATLSTTAQTSNIAPNQTSNVTTVNPNESIKAGFPQLPDTPNIVLGIIKDPRGKIIPNILVEIMNQQGVPVRAFKTNSLGQFAAATPLPNGEYTVILEDTRHQNEFEQIKITLDGTIFNPLEIISVDQREKLRRELFGAAPLVASA